MFDDTWQHEFTFDGFFKLAASEVITVNKDSVFNKPSYHKSIQWENNDNEYMPQGSGGTTQETHFLFFSQNKNFGGPVSHIK